MTETTRKLLIRIIGAPLLLALLAAILYWDYVQRQTIGLTVIMVVFTVGGLHEFYSMCEAKGHKPARWAGMVFAVLTILRFALLPYWPFNTAFFKFFNVDMLHYLFFLFLGLKLVFRHSTFSLVDGALSYLGYIYLTLWGYVLVDYSKIGWHNVYVNYKEAWSCFPPDFHTVGITIIIFLIATNKGADIAAFCFGKLFGRAKLAPTVSPNKTWVGAIAGVAIGTMAGLYVLPGNGSADDYLSKTDLLFMGSHLLFAVFLVTIASQIGDLVESAIKRWAGVKDSGRFIPEFGGFLDMIDGFLISIPVFYFAWPYTFALYLR